MGLSRFQSQALICSITPYFLEKGNVWFEENLDKILESRKLQSFFQENTVFLEKSQDCNFSQFLRKLDEMGYEKVYQISDPGEFSQRGGLIDVFPINLSQALRFEFLGNKIAEIFELPLEIKDEKSAKEILKKKLKNQKLFSDLKGLKPGDYLVHLDHGIGKFSGIEDMQIPSLQNQKYYVLEYAKGDKLYVPLGLERKLSKYIGFGEPVISSLSSFSWQKRKRKIKEDAEKLAKELMDIYAKRKIVKRSPYLPDDEIDFQLASSFPYEETPDQLEAIREIKKDLEKDEPMDRLLCGDVGFGKTEVAMRVALKAAKSGFQAALLCPTTILANQHFQNFKERLKDLPLKVSLISRLQSKKEQINIAGDLKAGKIDIIIGTHRLLSKDIDFKNLGLLIIDDEQGFGVKQKEKLKQMRASLDVLSLSATPIPRTLYLSLSSLRDVSLIQTPPSGRLPIKTFIQPFSEKTVKKAIEDEIGRGGQAYYLHNRVANIGEVKEGLEKLMPELKFAFIHGRMNEKELIATMEDFRNKKFNVLIATTIIENGLDLPNVNTLIVEDATRLGLAQSYQIRGRVGRNYIQASAYFLHPRRLKPLAKKRLRVLKESEELGSGYKIALKDLEIRGAGNILGREQSGNINSVGLNLYCQILSDSVEKLKSKQNGSN